MKFVIATKNKDKKAELARILAALGIEAVGDGEEGIALPEVEETGSTFEENARLKAESAVKATGLPACADDSGLCVDVLDGAPGLYSSRYAGESGSYADVMQKLLHVMENEDDRNARFISVICCLMPDGRELFVRGECEGVITREPKGNGGFGYDPVFAVGEKTFAQMTADEKDKLSHRGKALRKFADELPDFLKSGGKIC